MRGIIVPHYFSAPRDFLSTGTQRWARDAACWGTLVADTATAIAWYLYRHHLSAITVLFIHALHTPYEVPRVKSELRMSLELFEKSKVCKLPSIIRAAGRGDSIILAMLQVSPYRTTEVVLMMSYS